MLCDVINIDRNFTWIVFYGFLLYSDGAGLCELLWIICVAHVGAHRRCFICHHHNQVSLQKKKKKLYSIKSIVYSTHIHIQSHKKENVNENWKLIRVNKSVLMLEEPGLEKKCMVKFIWTYLKKHLLAFYSFSRVHAS